MQPIENHQYWLGLHLIPKFGIAKLNRLLAHFESAEALWLEPDADLLRLDLPRPLLRQFCASRRQIDLARELDRVDKVGASLVTLEDDNYPELLRSLPDRPPVLYVLGNLPKPDETCLAIVGTRRASRYGKDVAYRLAGELAQHGITIVSGLAQGIDSAAHRGALSAGGRSIALMGTGIDKVYPRENNGLARELVEMAH